MKEAANNQSYSLLLFSFFLNNANKTSHSESSTVAFCRMQNWMVKLKSGK